MTHVAARALIGPNLYTSGPAGVAEVELERAAKSGAPVDARSSANPDTPAPELAQELAQLEAAIVHEHIALREALGWPPAELIRRPYRCLGGGLGLALASPTSHVRAEACAVLLERAIWRALGESSGSQQDDLQAIRAQVDAEQRSPQLSALVNAATAHDLPSLVDDDAISIGHGVHGQTWPIGQIPAVDEVAWGEFGTIPIALITGTNGKTTSARMLARIALCSGAHVGNTSTDGVAVDGVVIEAGDWTGPGATRMVLRHPKVDFAALEIARGGLLRRGLVIDRADAALITNISADHLGDYGVTDLATMAAVKTVIGSVIPATGRVIMGADSAPLREVDTARLGAPIVWFALSPDNPTLRRHVRDGGEAWYVADGAIVHARRDREEPLLEVAAIPSTIGGAARHNVLNALGVTALAHALGISRAAIQDGLRSFRSSAEENPGRINRYAIHGATIILDFAHNLAGIGALGEVLRALRGEGRLTLAFGMAGDRNENDLHALAKALAALDPESMLLRDQKEFMRGRERGEVPTILRAGLIDSGLDPARIADVDDEIETIDRFLASSRPGDLLAILAHTQREPVVAHLAALGAASL